MFSRFAPAAACFLALSVASLASADVTLRLQHKKGDKRVYDSETNQKIKMNVGGNDVTIEQKISFDVIMTVEDVKDGVAQIKIKYGRAKMEMQSPLGPIEVDSNSDEEPANPIGKAVHAVVKGLAKFEADCEITDRGEIKSVKLKEGFGDAFKNLPGGDNLSKMMDGETMKQSLRDMGVVLPVEKIEKGSKWKVKIDGKSQFGSMKGEVEYTYQGSQSSDGKTLEKISVNPMVKVDAQVAGATITMKEQKGSGTVLLDNQAGRVDSLVNTQSMIMQIEVAGMAIEQNIETRTSMKLRK